MKRLKILQLNFTNSIGGTERNLIEYAIGFKKKGHYALTCTFQGEGTLSAEFRKKNLPFISIGITNPIKFFKIFKFIKFILREKFDVVHVYGLQAQVLGTPLVKLLGVPVVISGLRSTDDWRKLYHILVEKITYPFINGWIAVSNEVKRAFMRREKIPENKIIVIHNGVNTDLFSPALMRNALRMRSERNLTNDTFVIGYVANIKPLKGHEDLVRALKIVEEKYSNFKAFFVGEDRMKGEIQNLINKLGLGNKIQIPGFISNIRQFLPIFDLFVIPSHLEGLPTAMLEVMACGIPVVGTTAGGIPEVITNYEDGILVPIKDQEVLAAKILEIIQNKPLKEKLSRNGILTVQKWFSIDRKIEEILEYYNLFLKIEPHSKFISISPF